MNVKHLLFYSLIVSTAPSAAISSEDPYMRSVRLLDAICISSMFQEITFNANAKHLGFASIDKNKLIHIDPSAKYGYEIEYDSETYISIFGEKTNGKQISKNCTITFKGTNHQRAQRMIESNFNFRKIETLRQGVTEISVYLGNLIGTNHQSMIIIQSGHGFISYGIAQAPE